MDSRSTAVALGDCATEPNNLISNCNFAANINMWSQDIGTFSYDAVNGSNAPGAMQIAATTPGTGPEAQSTQCIPAVAPSTTYNFGIDHQLVSGAVPTDGCVVNVSQRNAANCVWGAAVQVVRTFTPGAAFAQTTLHSITTTAGAVSARLHVQCDAPGAFTINLGDAFVGTGLVPVELQGFSVE